MTGAAAEDGRFEKLSVYLERNVQDHDAEIRFEATGADDGLAALKVSAPGERTVIELKTPDSKLGIRSLTLESPEPDDDRIVRADFPAGAYRFEGTTTKGESLRGEAQLSHVFPKPAAFEYPRPDQKDVPATALTLRWSVPEGIEACAIVIEQTGSAYEIRALLPGSAKSFTVPDRVLARWQGLQIRDRDHRQGRQSVLHRSRLHHCEGAMNQPAQAISDRQRRTVHAGLLYGKGGAPALLVRRPHQAENFRNLGRQLAGPPPATGGQ